MNKPAAIIYIVTNLINGKCYVGLTRFSIEKRWREHRYHSSRKSRSRFLRAVAKYGAGNFSIVPIASCLSLSTASEVECSLIQRLKPEYNQTNGGEFTFGKRVSREVVERIRAKNTGLKRTPEMNKAMSVLKKKQYDENPELKARIIEQIKIARGSVNEQKRIAAARLVNIGKKRTDEERAHLRAIHTGMKHSSDIIEKVAQKHRKPVECIELNRIFTSVSEAAATTGLSISGVSSVCLGKRNSANGLTFKFL